MISFFFNKNADRIYKINCSLEPGNKNYAHQQVELENAFISSNIINTRIAKKARNEIIKITGEMSYVKKITISKIYKINNKYFIYMLVQSFDDELIYIIQI